MPADLNDVVVEIARLGEPLDRIAGFFDRLAGEQDAEQAEKIAAAQVVEQRFDEMLELLALGANDGAHHKDWVLDQIARLILGPAYERWAAENGWDNVTDNAIAP